MAGLVPAIHAAPRHIALPLRTCVSPEVYDEAAVFSWMAGSSPAMTEKQNSGPAHIKRYQCHKLIYKKQKPCYVLRIR
jgi:hypothetical protein